MARVEQFVGLLQEWNARINLVSERSMQDVWQRHVWDSAQLLPFIPKAAESLVDLGTGAGFPGLVLAIIAQQPLRVVLYESIAKKCRFLEEVAFRLSSRVEVRNSRIEAAKPEAFDVITARACASLTQLLGYAERFRGKNTICLFLKGQTVGDELREAAQTWSMTAETHQSRSDHGGSILEIREFSHVR